MSVSRFERAPIERYPAKAAWEPDAADLVATMLERWHLTPGEAFTGGEASAALAVTTAEGAPAVLKVGFPHHEAVGEALALEEWSPALAPRVLRQDAWTWSLLLERVEPGIPLSRTGLSAVESLEVAGGLLARLHAHRIPDGVPAIREVVEVWLDDAAQSVPPPDASPDDVLAVRARLADAAVLLDSDGGRSLLHGDANPGNLLVANDGSWLAIDPKPMAGDREFDLGPAVEQIDDPWSHPDPRAVLESRFRVLVDATGSSWDRAVRWAAVRAALDLEWAWQDGNRSSAAAAARRLATWESLSAS